MISMLIAIHFIKVYVGLLFNKILDGFTKHSFVFALYLPNSYTVVCHKITRTMIKWGVRVRPRKCKIEKY